MSAAARFDEIVHAPNRLQICAILSAVDSADFATVRECLGVADSVLSKRIRVLHGAGYLDGADPAGVADPAEGPDQVPRFDGAAGAGREDEVGFWPGRAHGESGTYPSRN
jgi:hypothetical protein